MESTVDGSGIFEFTIPTTKAGDMQEEVLKIYLRMTYYLSKYMAQNASFLARCPDFTPTCQNLALQEAFFSTGLPLSHS